MRLDNSAKKLFKITALIVTGLVLPTQIFPLNATYHHFLSAPMLYLLFILPFALLYTITLREKFLRSERKRMKEEQQEEEYHKNDIKFSLRYQPSEIEGHSGTRWELKNIGNMPWKQGVLLLERMDNRNVKRVERHPLPNLQPKEKSYIYSHIEPVPRARWKGMVLTTHGYGVDLGERWEEHGWLNKIAQKNELLIREKLKI
jgi:hypothetical protein